MIRNELIGRIAEVMRENGTRKAVSVPRQVFHISDDEGHTQDFYIRQTDTIDLIGAAVISVTTKRMEEAFAGGAEAAPGLDHLDVDMVMGVASSGAPALLDELTMLLGAGNVVLQ